MKTRFLQALYLMPAIMMLMMWIAAAPSYVSQCSNWQLLGTIALSAFGSAWSVAIFAHSVKGGSV